MDVQRLKDLCQVAIDTAAAHPFKLAPIESPGTGAHWQTDPPAGTDQDIAQYFAACADTARVGLGWLSDVTPLVLPAASFHPSSDDADAALAATQHVALDGSRVLVVPDRPVDLPNPGMQGMQLVAALCFQPGEAFEMIAFAQQAGNPLVLPHVVVVPNQRPSPELLRHRGVLLIGKDGEVASFTSVHSAAHSGTALRAAGLALDLVVAALWEHERRSAPS